MPFVQISIAEGRDPDQIRALIGGVTDAVADSLAAPVESIRVIVTEVPLTHWGSGSVTLAEKRGAATALGARTQASDDRRTGPLTGKES